jgi:hypothetical protein
MIGRIQKMTNDWLDATIDSMVQKYYMAKYPLNSYSESWRVIITDVEIEEPSCRIPIRKYKNNERLSILGSDEAKELYGDKKVRTLFDTLELNMEEYQKLFDYIDRKYKKTLAAALATTLTKKKKIDELQEKIQMLKDEINEVKG